MATTSIEEVAVAANNTGVPRHHSNVVPTSFIHRPNSGPTSAWRRAASARRRPAIGPMDKWRRYDVVQTSVVLFAVEVDPNFYKAALEFCLF